MARADPVKLRQILLNVLGNAIKFTPAGGRIELSAHPSGDRISICVSDTGIGIPADKIDRVFDPFFQGQSGTTREYPGVGLGLSISRDFARAMEETSASRARRTRGVRHHRSGVGRLKARTVNAHFDLLLSFPCG